LAIIGSIVSIIGKFRVKSKKVILGKKFRQKIL